ncbi:hypothetical protein C8R44DRAFT_723513 [Mycena epipterygia]|nr:hypothetical protein C8R44DRAFT_723513 [Mycena epipterygia]
MTASIHVESAHSVAGIVHTDTVFNSGSAHTVHLKHGTHAQWTAHQQRVRNIAAKSSAMVNTHNGKSIDSFSRSSPHAVAFSSCRSVIPVIKQYTYHACAHIRQNDELSRFSIKLTNFLIPNQVNMEISGIVFTELLQEVDDVLDRLFDENNQPRNYHPLSVEIRTHSRQRSGPEPLPAPPARPTLTIGDLFPAMREQPEIYSPILGLPDVASIPESFRQQLPPGISIDRVDGTPPEIPPLLFRHFFPVPDWPGMADLRLDLSNMPPADLTQELILEDMRAAGLAPPAPAPLPPSYRNPNIIPLLESLDPRLQQWDPKGEEEQEIVNQILSDKRADEIVDWTCLDGPGEEGSGDTDDS